MYQFNNIYYNRRVLVTGHTGFKGSWLSLWLQKLGAKVFGLAKEGNTRPNHWDVLQLGIEEDYVDIRDITSLTRSFQRIRPHMVFHLAAQPLVKQSYLHPLETWSANVNGTANILEICRNISEISAVLVVTTDKVYKNNEWPWGYRETDLLEGHDPYSASKAAVELVVNSYRRSFYEKTSSPLLATARAGNVIGGGDWALDRLIPDLIRTVQSGSILEIRYPLATRPWQHVLDCLSGYLLLGEKLLEGKREFANAWNFGPDHEGNVQVIDILNGMQKYWPEISWKQAQGDTPHETNFLYLDSSKARKLLKWQPVWHIDNALSATAEWYKSFAEDKQILSRQQLDAYLNTAKNKCSSWLPA